MITIWQEIDGKPERAYTASLERDRKRLRMLGLQHAPDRTALYRTRKRLSEEYMRQLNQKILEGLGPSKKVGADATGLRQSRRDCAWSSTGEDGRRAYVKLHALFDLEKRTVDTFETTRGTEHECRHFGEFLGNLNDIECVVADPCYLSRMNCKIIAEKGGTPYIKPKKNSLMKAKGCWIWKSMVTLFREHPRIFNRFYKLHQRVEARMALAQKHRRRHNQKQNKTNHKNRNLVKNHLLQPHLDSQRKLRILSQTLFSSCTFSVESGVQCGAREA